MKPDPRFVAQPRSFWANVRAISQKAGYTVTRKRGSNEPKKVKVPTLAEMEDSLKSQGLLSFHLHQGKPPLHQTLTTYFKYRAKILNTYVEPRLMDADRARVEFERLRAELDPKCPCR